MNELKRSKKFLVSILAVGVMVLLRLMEPTMAVADLLAIVSPLMVYVGAQGMADMGKEKAKAGGGA